jgi:signal transduction histidine kinase
VTPTTPDERLRQALDTFVTQGGPFVLPAGPPPTDLLPAPPGGPPPDTKLHAALPTPPAIPRPPRRDVSSGRTPPPRTHRAVVSADAVLPGLDHVVWSVSPDGKLVFLLGGAVERLYGRPAEFFLDAPDGWFHAVAEPDRPAVLAAFARLRTTDSFTVEHADAGGGRSLVSRGRLVRRPDGAPVRVDGTTTEVRESAAERELKAKLAAAEERLRQAGRLETLGRLVTGVAHDFNNCLTVISGNAQLVRDLLAPDDPVRERADEIVAYVGSAAVVAGQLVAFGKPTLVDEGPIDPTAEVRALERLLRRLAGDAVTLDVLLTPGVHPIPVGAGAFAQVLLNLVANARDAIPGRGTISLRSAEAVVDRGRPGWPPGLPPGRFVTVTVADNGVGMSDAVRARVFEPYFTTKGDGGNGVGLATVAAVVRAARGHVEVESGEGWGTSVRVFFPPAAGPAAVVPPALTPAPPPRTATILLVQDGTAVRDLTAVALQHAGYRILEADDGTAGEERARLYAGPIDLLVTDVGLPKQDGPALAAAVRAARPGLKVLFLSGSRSPGVGSGEFLAKPYTTEGLLHAVGRALGGG